MLLNKLQVTALESKIMDDIIIMGDIREHRPRQLLVVMFFFYHGTSFPVKGQRVCKGKK